MQKVHVKMKPEVTPFKHRTASFIICHFASYSIQQYYIASQGWTKRSQKVTCHKLWLIRMQMHEDTKLFFEYFWVSREGANKLNYPPVK